MSKNLFAYTAPGVNYPLYISINAEKRFSGDVTITVRSAASKDGTCGPTAEITLTNDQMKELIEKLTNV